jgi:hypothetical protein
VVVCPATLPTPLFQGEVPATSMVTLSNGALTYRTSGYVGATLSTPPSDGPPAHSQLYHRLTWSRVRWHLDTLPVILHGAQVTLHSASRAIQIHPLADSHLHHSILPLAARGFRQAQYNLNMLLQLALSFSSGQGMIT